MPPETGASHAVVDPLDVGFDCVGQVEPVVGDVLRDGGDTNYNNSWVDRKRQYALALQNGSMLE